MAFDEVAGIKFKDKDGIQIMKDYMASGSFAPVSYTHLEKGEILQPPDSLPCQDPAV